ncbi:hypothetical protein [Sphingomonas sp. NFX23]|uniref:hypothetical protein n=1 Tax=Sphingomonas sp. NFX23 TaxID=2819532 RepID=UPI003CEAC168
MGELLTGITEPSGLIIAAAASASAAVTDLVEASRGTMDLATNLGGREVAENLADALQSVCSIELEADDLNPERREVLGQLLGAISRFIEGWA